MTRSQAKAAGRSHYWGGRTCSKGHTDGRRVNDKKCLGCDRERKRRLYARLAAEKDTGHG